MNKLKTFALSSVFVAAVPILGGSETHDISGGSFVSTDDEKTIIIDDFDRGGAGAFAQAFMFEHGGAG